MSERSGEVSVLNEPPPGESRFDWSFDRIDWAATPLGAPGGWPGGLRGVIDTLLGSPLPMALLYGPDCFLIYNAACTKFLGSQHPSAFGRPASEVVEGDWLPGDGRFVTEVMRTGEPFLDPDTLLPVHGETAADPPEHVHLSRAYTAARGDDGQILGVLAVVIETTEVTRALTGVAELATRLAGALSVDDVVREALHYAVKGASADHARVMLVDGPALRMARRAGADFGDESIDRLPPLWVRVPVGARLPSAEVTSSGRPLWLGPGQLGRYPALEDEPAGASRLGGIATVPLHTGGVSGALSFGWEQIRGFGPAERAALITVGNLVGQALARARRFDEQRGHAETLQRSMLPAELPQVDGLSLAARYIPSAPGTSAGGDFYDAFPLDDGRVFLAIGDVVGHGVLAAAVMGQVRAGLRVLALRHPDPVDVLAGLDAFVASLGAEMFATALVGTLDVGTGEIVLASAGHPAPLIRQANGRGSGFLAVPAGPPLGVTAPRSPLHAALCPDDIMILYTDGLVEVAGQDLDIGLSQLSDLVESRRDIADPRRLCTLLLDELGTGNDDTAVMTVARDDGQRRTSSLDVPAESSAPGSARRWARTVLTRWGIDEERLQRALLGLNELVTNAFLHARSTAHVELDLDEHRLLVLVTDRGLSSTVSLQDPDPAAVRGRGLALVEALADAWGNERTSRGTTVWFELTQQPAQVVG